MEQKTATSNDGKKGDIGSVTGVVKLRGQTQLPQEFITPAKTFDEALAKTTIRDINQLNDIIHAYHKMDRLDKRGKFKEMKQILIDLLIGLNSLNGYSRSLAAMAFTGIYLPEGAGIKMDKKDREALTELQRMREANRNERGEEKGQ